ncbi:MAG: prepilin-type N-terminal cleavage/methylation domain-containing protein [Candidatus Levybacteria bacterium]|nr:prepilin-type N-terminal cleavage/methylation domain-containing protein [Candidatus Levybacteria bacterium]
MHLPIRKISNWQHGLTLIELLLVISIVSIVSLSATPFYARFLTQNAVSDTTDRIIGSLRKAQIYSMMGKQNSAWGVRYTGNILTLYVWGNTAFDENFTVGSNITISGLTDIVFAKTTGLPTPSTLTIIITGGNTTKTVSVNAEGAVMRQ